MWILWCAECLCLSPWLLQFILERITWRIYIPPKISHSKTIVRCDKEVDLRSKGIQGFSMNDWHRSWQRTTLLTDRAVHLSTATIYVFSDSVLCMGKMSAWKEKDRMVYGFIPMSRIGSNRRGADGARVESFPGFTTSQILAEIQKNDDWNTVRTWAIYRTNHLHVNVQWHCMERKKETQNCVLQVSKTWQDVQDDLRTDIGRFSGLDQRRSGTELITYKPNGEWDHVAEDGASRVPWIQCFGTRIFARQRRWRIVHALLCWYRYSRSGSSHDSFRESVQCLRICVTNWPRGFLTSESTGRPVAEDKSETMVVPTDNDQTTSVQRSSARRLAARIRTDIWKSSRWSSIDQTVLRCRFHKDCR